MIYGTVEQQYNAFVRYITDKIDSRNILFPENAPADVLEMMKSLPVEVFALRKAAEHVVLLQTIEGRENRRMTLRHTKK